MHRLPYKQEPQEGILNGPSRFKYLRHQGRLGSERSWMLVCCSPTCAANKCNPLLAQEFEAHHEGSTKKARRSMGMLTALPRGSPASGGQPFGQPATILSRGFNTRTYSRTDGPHGWPTDGGSRQLETVGNRHESATVRPHWIVIHLAEGMGRVDPTALCHDELIHNRSHGHPSGNDHVVEHNPICMLGRHCDFLVLNLCSRRIDRILGPRQRRLCFPPAAWL
jgi:hypothetical protein